LIWSLLTVFVLSPLALAKPEVCIRNHCFEVDVASTPPQRSKGLMYREVLEPDQGMWFVFQQPQKYGFWMKNMVIPVDIIWVNNEYKIVFIAEDVQPCQKTPCTVVSPDKAASFVLEVPAGSVGGFRFQIGDRVKVIDSKDN